MEYIAIAECGIEDGEIKKLAQLKNLKRLTISKVSNQLIEALKKMEIEHLTVGANSQTTDEDIMKFTAVKSLKELYVSGCPRVNKAIVYKFNSLHPLRIMSIEASHIYQLQNQIFPEND